jgi:CheY-like chemotaxis protein
MVHWLAAQLCGAMQISCSVGVVTCVGLWLALSHDEVMVAEANGTDPSDAHFGAVLLVDDEPLIRMSTADMLTDLGYSVTEAGSAEQAIDAIAGGFTPDLLITDHLMPGMTGTELAAQVRRRFPAVKILVISGYAEAGGLDPDLPRLTKPFRESDLSARLQDLSPVP